MLGRVLPVRVARLAVFTALAAPVVGPLVRVPILANLARVGPVFGFGRVASFVARMLGQGVFVPFVLYASGGGVFCPVVLPFMFYTRLRLSPLAVFFVPAAPVVGPFLCRSVGAQNTRVTSLSALLRIRPDVAFNVVRV